MCQYSLSHRLRFLLRSIINSIISAIDEGEKTNDYAVEKLSLARTRQKLWFSTAIVESHLFQCRRMEVTSGNKQKQFLLPLTESLINIIIVREAHF